MLLKDCVKTAETLPTVKPSPPVNLRAIDFTKESVTLSWEPPVDTGRGKIFGYLLEFQKAGEEEWLKVRQIDPFQLNGLVFLASSFIKLNSCTAAVIR